MPTLRESMEARKRQLCRPPTYAGRPDDYVYVPEMCRKKRANNGARPALTALRRELEQVETWLAEHPMDPAGGRLAAPNQPVPRAATAIVTKLLNSVQDVMRMVPKLFEGMTAPAQRRAHPSTHARFTHIYGNGPQHLRDHMKQVVFKMLAVHLRTLLRR